MGNYLYYDHKKKVLSNTCIICFPYAGGNANIFRKYCEICPELLILPVELPGHGRRYKEKFAMDYRTMAVEIAKEINDKMIGFSIYLYGHSLGSILAYEVAYCLEKTYGIIPKLLIVSGRNAPFVPEVSTFKTSMGDDALLDELRRYDFMPPEILENKDFLKYYIPVVKSDYQLGERYCFVEHQKLSMPIWFHFGDEDIDINFNEIDSWEDVTSNNVTKKVFSGKHFFMFEDDSTYFDQLFIDVYNYEQQIGG